MRRPVRSHVANRKMFQGGGLSPLPQPTGILASSQSLVDQVAQNAVNPAGNVMMNQGGFANGGEVFGPPPPPYFPGQKIQDVTVDVGGDLLKRGRNVLGRVGVAGQYGRSYLPPVLGGQPFQPEHDTLVSSGQLVQGREGSKVSETGTLDITTFGDPLGVNKDFNWVEGGPQAGSMTYKDFDFQSLTGKIMGAKDWFNETPSLTGRRIFPKFEELKGVGGLDSAVHKMTWHLPQYKDQIEQIAAQIIEQTPDITPEDLRNQIAVTLKTNIEGQNPGLIKIKQEGAANLYSDVPADANTITLAESIDASKRPIDQLLTEMSGQPQIGPDINLLEKMEHDQQIAALIPFWRERDFGTGFIETLREKGVSDEVLSGLVNQRIDLIAERDRPAGEKKSEGYGVGPRDRARKADGKDYGSFPGARGSRADAPIIDLGEITELQDVVSSQGYDDEQEAEDKKLISENVIKNIADSEDPKAKTETADLLEKFKKEFISAMPEYQGMSNDEKAFAWIKMGMAIAGGESPNAIKNITDGVLATLDEFSDDPKQKRAYTMKVNLMASEYAIARADQARTRMEEKEDTLMELFFIEDYTDPVTNITHRQGTMPVITQADFLSGRYKEWPLGSSPIVQEFIESAEAARVYNEAAAAAGIIDIKDYEKLSKSYKEHELAVNDVRNGVVLNGLLNNVQGQLGWDFETNSYNPKANQITGIVPYIRSVGNRVYNMFPTLLADKETKGSLEWLKYNDIDKYNRELRYVANQMIRELLGEGSRNISNLDRQLAEELVGLFKSGTLITASPEVMIASMQRIQSSIQASIKNGLINIPMEQTKWVDYTTRGGVKPGDLMTAKEQLQFTGLSFPETSFVKKGDEWERQERGTTRTLSIPELILGEDGIYDLTFTDSS
jgi:hypothetical protein